ncbi:DUF605-domain-containing protein [Dacryopinax primogenitus]|uniref:DUF605-domain-containing protein n=1 Tax=Dacryopinax primogenitus (strain DJM 731) TaxID=1858805 RepID=M5GB69_DACPD|nr:DUF605-domain-containing protein [Dacryopinax primogenitus]EJU01198.1 DUF605-domain-containing protein [Dacryopinax primogenitus]
MPPKAMLPANIPSSAACPTSLKPIAPFVQRAAEVKTADPVVAYWCLYNAARLGLPLAKSHDAEAKHYIDLIVKYLESSKSALAGEKAISDTDVACERIGQFAEHIFGSADNEDRTGAATKLTAKKFLAAANFMQLLAIFDRERDVAEKIKYAKWKASDIAKALREGRVPLAGPAGGDNSPISEHPFSGAAGFPDTAADGQTPFTSGNISPPRAGTIPHTPSAWSTVATPGPDYTDERRREGTHWPQESPTPASGQGVRATSTGHAGDKGDDEGGESDGGYWSTVSTPGTAFVDGKHFFAQQQRPLPPPSPPTQPSRISSAPGSSSYGTQPPTNPNVRRVRFTESTAGGSEDLNDPAPMSPIDERQETPGMPDLRTPTVTPNIASVPPRLSPPKPVNILPTPRDKLETLPSVFDDEPSPPLKETQPRRSSSNSPPRNGLPLRPSITTGVPPPTVSIDTPASSRESSCIIPSTIPMAQHERRPSQDRQDRGPPTIDTNVHHIRGRSNSGSTPVGPPSGWTPVSRKDNGSASIVQGQGLERRSSVTNGRTPITPENGPAMATPTGTRDSRNSLLRRGGPPTVALTSARERRGSGSSSEPIDRSFLAPPSATLSRPSQSLQNSPSRGAQFPLPDSSTSSRNPSPDMGHQYKPLPGHAPAAKGTPITPSAPVWNGTSVSGRPSSLLPSAPALAPSAPVPPPVPDFYAMSQAKKHASYAISALSFEDVATAKKELLEALSFLGGP